MNTYKSHEDVVKEIPAFVPLQIELQYNIAERIQALMALRGLSQKQLSSDLAMNESQLSYILSGEANVTLRTIARFEAYFGERIIEIAGDNDPVEGEVPHNPEKKFSYPAKPRIAAVHEPPAEYKHTRCMFTVDAHTGKFVPKK